MVTLTNTELREGMITFALALIEEKHNAMERTDRLAKAVREMEKKRVTPSRGH